MKSDVSAAAPVIRPEIAALAPYVPGTTVDAVRTRYGLTQITKLSSNENPWGSSPKAIAALRAITQLNIYVNDDYAELRAKIGARNTIPVADILLGHGSNELLALLCTTSLSPGDEVVMAVPSFSLYRSNTLIAGAVPIEIPLRAGVHDLTAMAAAIGPKTKMIMICDPNNPTGTQVSQAAFAEFVERIPPSVLLVIDQAYREYAEGGVEGADIARLRPNTIVLRTASKVYGLAALRFGFAMTSPGLASWFGRARLPFNVSLPALAAVDAALDDDAFIAKSVGMNATERARVADAAAALGCTSYPSAANFLAIAVPGTATQAYEALLRVGVIVRSGDGLRMPGYLRVTIGTPDENTLFLAALTAYVRELKESGERA